MWYNSRPMWGRGLSLTLLVLLALQLVGGIAEEPLCVEPCPDDDEGESCPPVCTLCTSCTHAKSAIVRWETSGMPPGTAERCFPEPAMTTPSQLASDIFHVPLAA